MHLSFIMHRINNNGGSSIMAHLNTLLHYYICNHSHNTQMQLISQITARVALV